MCEVLYPRVDKGMMVYVDSFHRTYLVIQIMMSYDESTYLVFAIMIYDWQMFASFYKGFSWHIETGPFFKCSKITFFLSCYSQELYFQNIIF